MWEKVISSSSSRRLLPICGPPGPRMTECVGGMPVIVTPPAWLCIGTSIVVEVCDRFAVFPYGLGAGEYIP